MSVRKDKVQIDVEVNGQKVTSTFKQLKQSAKDLNRELDGLEPGTEAFIKKAAELKTVNDRLAEIRRQTRGVTSAVDKLKNKGGGAFNFLSIRAGAMLATFVAAFSVEKIIDWTKHILGAGAQMDALARKAQTVLGEELDNVTDKARENAAAMGLTTAQYVDAATAAADLLIPMGFQRAEASEISTNLIDLSGALSEWTGGQKSATDVAQTLQKAMLGEREELKGLGISISENDVKTRLAALGLDKLTGTMLQQAKATATLQLITEKSTDAQTAYANGTDSAIRKQAELTAKIAEISAKLVDTLFPVFERLVDFAGSITDAVESVADALGYAVDPAKALTGAFDEQTRKVGNLEKDLLPLLERYEELQGQSELSGDEQKELGNLIARVGDLTPTAITKIDEYGVALGISAGKAREFLEAEKARLQFVNEDAISATSDTVEDLKQRQEELLSLIEFGRTIRVPNVNEKGSTSVRVSLGEKEIIERRKELFGVTKKLEGAEFELKRLRGDSFSDIEEGAEGVSDAVEEAAADIVDVRKLSIAELKKLANSDAFEELARRKQLVKDLEERRKLREKAFDAELEGVRLAFQRTEFIADAQRIKEEITEKEFHQRLHDAEKEFYNGQLDVLEKYGRDATNQALEIQNKLLEAQKLDRNVLVPERLETNKLTGVDSDGKDSETKIDNDTDSDLIDLENKFANLLIAEQDYEEMRLQIQLEAAERRLALLQESGTASVDQIKAAQTNVLNIEKTLMDERIENEKRLADVKEKISGGVKKLQGDALDFTIAILSQDEKARKKNATAIKAFESAKVLVNLFSEISGYNKAYSGIPGIGPAIAGGLSALAAARAGLAIKTINAQKFFRGGKLKQLSGERVNENPNVPTQSGGDNILAVLKAGEVVLNREQQQALGGDAIFQNIGVPGFNGGGFVSDLNLTSVDTNPKGAFASDSSTFTQPSTGGGGLSEQLLERAVIALERMPDTLTAELVYEDLKTKESEEEFSNSKKGF